MWHISIRQTPLNLGVHDESHFIVLCKCNSLYKNIYVCVCLTGVCQAILAKYAFLFPCKKIPNRDRYPASANVLKYVSTGIICVMDYDDVLHPGCKYTNIEPNLRWAIHNTSHFRGFIVTPDIAHSRPNGVIGPQITTALSISIPHMVLRRWTEKKIK